MIVKAQTEPTPEDCSARRKLTLVIHGEQVEGWACWYPQMGGYVGCAFVVDRGGCFDAYVWHDGEFPFGEDNERSPARLHHCDAAQFISFGEFVESVVPSHDARPGPPVWVAACPCRGEAYSITTAKEGPVCPDCGRPYTPQPAAHRYAEMRATCSCPPGVLRWDWKEEVWKCGNCGSPWLPPEERE